MVRSIPLSHGLFALVDDADYDRLSAYKWYARAAYSKAGPQIGWYAQRQAQRDGKRHTVYLHRLITQAPKSLVVDHIDGDGLNNVRTNLRVCTIGQNNTNRPAPLSASGYRGVHPKGKKWRALLACGGVRLRGPYRETPLEAAVDYDRLAAEHQGEFAILNFPKKGAA